MPHWEFSRTEPVSLYVHSTSGSITVTAEPTELITVDVRPSRPGRHADESAERVVVELTGDVLKVAEPEKLISWPRGGLDIQVTLPAGSDCEAETSSAEISCLGELGSLSVRTASGAVHAETVAGSAQVTGISGRVAVASASTVTVSTSSGPIELGEVTGALEVTSVSGPVQVGTAGGLVVIQTNSGRVRLGNVSRDTTQVDTISGDVSIRVAPETDVYLDLVSISGKVSSDLEPADPADPGAPAGQAALQLHCSSVSGPIRVGRAPASTPAASAAS
jgi:hypothetical protein